jgi:hypothetical protein
MILMQCLDLLIRLSISVLSITKSASAEDAAHWWIVHNDRSRPEKHFDLLDTKGLIVFEFSELRN